MDNTDYQIQCEKLLSDEKTYTKLRPADHTKLLKGRIQRTLRATKKAGHIDQKRYDMIYPISGATPWFYATPKIHKDPLKMRPTVSGINSITYTLTRHLADVLKP